MLDFNIVSILLLIMSSDEHELLLTHIWGQVHVKSGNFQTFLKFKLPLPYLDSACKMYFCFRTLGVRALCNKSIGDSIWFGVV